MPVRIPELRAIAHRRSLGLLAAALVCIGCTVPAAQETQGPSVSSAATPSASATPTTSSPTSEPTSGCPALDATLSELIAIGRREARDCFGNSQLTLRGWVWEDRGAYDCVTYSAPGDPLPPDWLYCAATEHARLTPVPYAPGEPIPGSIRPADGPFMVAVDPASPAAGILRPNQWVEVVGRFHDPVTELCELVADPSFREQCLTTFVVREARVIDAP